MRNAYLGRCSRVGMPTKEYLAIGPDDVVVVTDGKKSDLPLRLDLVRHSPTGFSWGYGGSGPAQLALAILADYLGDREAIRQYQDFKWDMIAGLPQGQPWSIKDVQIDAWLNRTFTQEV